MADNRNKKDDKLEKCELGDNELGEVGGGSDVTKLVRGKLPAGQAKLMYGIPPIREGTLVSVKYGIGPKPSKEEPSDIIKKLNPLPNNDGDSKK